ncbi:MAG: GspE/PulE family protein [Deltaproteobacteria bacterium]|nr:GspE/PulE family protein [Deltaproteobacteria bacterium]MBW2338960.1 GspE/PulE family protein [Deltaproteobacteria bacterium]
MAVPNKDSANKKINNIQVLQKELEFSKRLNFITNKIHSSRDIDDILINLRESILGIFSADRLTIYVVDGTSKEIVSRFKTGTEINEIRVPITNTSIAGYCASSGKMANIVNAYDDSELERINPELTFDRSWDEKTGYKTKQVLVAPVKFKKYLLGVIQLVNKVNGKYFSLEDQKNVTEIAQVLGIAFYNHRKLLQRGRATKFDYLIRNNIITRKNLEGAMALARTKKDSAESVLMNSFNVTKDDIGKSLAAFYNTRFVAFDEKMVIPGQLLKGLRPKYLKDNLFVPVGQSDSKIVIAMENPEYLPGQDAVKRLLPGKDFEFCVALREDIIMMINHFFDIKKVGLSGDSGSIEEILGQLETAGDEEAEYDEELGGVTEEDGAIVRLVSKTIIDAYNRGASDIHIEPRMGKADAVIRFRIDGACHVYQTIPYTYKNAVCSRIKIMSDLDIAERRLPQDGKIKFKKYGPLDIELRVASIPTTGRNEDIVMRLLPTGEPMALDQMGMSEKTYNAFIDVITRPYGVVLCVGPTGSGKTTTLHSALRYINKTETKIWTAEDPVEITQEGLRQVQIHPKIGLDFAAAMRAFLRADPDVIMVGEMRDHETLSTGIEASLTGHLVFSTLHTNSAPETITRMLDMGMDPFNFADALLGILAQRLVRTLCKDCKEEYHPSREEFDALVRAYNGDFDALNISYTDDLVFFRAKGCSNCQNIGYKGRMGIHELLVGTPEMKTLIQTKAPMVEIRNQAIADGMTTLMQDGIRKVFLGLTDMKQVRRVCM